jgi:hypothetical protein
VDAIAALSVALSRRALAASEFAPSTHLIAFEIYTVNV